MKKRLKSWQRTGFLFTGISGTLLHFIYDWTNECIIVAPFSAVNESTWEHMKLLFFPMLVFAVIQYKVMGRAYEDFWCVKLTGTLAGLTLIPVLFYTYSGVLGKTADWFNITIFFISAAFAYWLEYIMLKNEYNCRLSAGVAVAVFVVIAAAFVIFTFIQPKVPLFMDPVTNSYGVQLPK